MFLANAADAVAHDSASTFLTVFVWRRALNSYSDLVIIVGLLFSDV